MSAQPAPGAASRAAAGSIAAAQWAHITAAAPQVAATVQRYLQRLGVFLAPASVDAAENALRQLARWMITEAGLAAVGDIGRDDIEDYKVWLAAQPRGGGRTITAETHRQRMRTIRQFSGSDHRVGLARRPVPQPGHRFQHCQITLFTSFNRGMRLEAIAAMPGHRSLDMTLRYAKIANRVVAGEYAAVSAKTGALYGQPPALPADYETTGMARLRREAHARMLGNGLCTRPAELDCRLESACETCAYFRTGTEFLPILTRQRDHARDHGQPERAALSGGLIQHTKTERS